ncbi:hypothetical protein I4U23_021072 [Adineta vaga]|nr:hypothetical protein I4U23_021072 [Adineta vaga]
MALSYHHRFINKVQLLFSNLLTFYDPFGDKLLEHFRLNPYYPFIHTQQSLTFEYRYRRWSTISFLIILQIVLIFLTLYTFYRFHTDEYWNLSSNFLLVSIFGLLTLFLVFNLIENFKQRRIILSPLDFHVSIYINNHLIQQCSIDRAYICLHRIESYNILLYHLVFIIEDMDFIPISDYFSYKLHLRQIGKCLAENLFLSYIESENWRGIFPKYKKLMNYINRNDNEITNENNHLLRKRHVHSHTIINL